MRLTRYPPTPPIEGHLPFEHPIEQYQLYSTRNYPDLRELLALAARERELQSIHHYEVIDLPVESHPIRRF